MKQLIKLIILFSLFFVFACRKDDPTPVPPVIEFVDARLSADRSFSIVRFDFVDDDGDLGLGQNENMGEQAFNLFVDYFEKENGVWVLRSPIITFNNTDNQFDTTTLNLRIPFIENETNTKLEGETSVDLLYNFNADTFRYEIYIKDRALHESNRITTSELFLN